MAFRVRNRLWQILLSVVLVAVVASWTLRLTSQKPGPPSRDLIELREAADREFEEYLRLRDQLDEKFQAAVDAFDGNPPKMKEANEELEPLRQKVKKQEEKYDRALEKAQAKSAW